MSANSEFDEKGLSPLFLTIILVLIGVLLFFFDNAMQELVPSILNWAKECFDLRALVAGILLFLVCIVPFWGLWQDILRG